MPTDIRKTISLPPDLAREAEEVARAEGKTVSAVVQEALRLARRTRRRQELKGIQAYWRVRAKEQGIFTEDALARYLRG